MLVVGWARIVDHQISLTAAKEINWFKNAAQRVPGITFPSDFHILYMCIINFDEYSKASKLAIRGLMHNLRTLCNAAHALSEVWQSKHQLLLTKQVIFMLIVVR